MSINSTINSDGVLNNVVSCLDLSDTLNVATTSKNAYANTSRAFLYYRCGMYSWFGNLEGIRESVKDFFRSNIAPIASDVIRNNQEQVKIHNTVQFLPPPLIVDSYCNNLYAEGAEKLLQHRHLDLFKKYFKELYVFKSFREVCCVNHDMKALIIKALEEEESTELPEISDGDLSRTNAIALKDMILNDRLASAEFLYSSNSDICYIQLRQGALCLAELGDFRLFHFLISKSPEFFSEDLGDLLNYAINHQNGAVVSYLLSKDLDELDVSFAFSTALEKGKLGVIKHFLSSGRNFDGWHLIEAIQKVCYFDRLMLLKMFYPVIKLHWTRIN